MQSLLSDFWVKHMSFSKLLALKNIVSDVKNYNTCPFVGLKELTVWQYLIVIEYVLLFCMFKEHENTLNLESNLSIFLVFSACICSSFGPYLDILGPHFWVPEPGVHWVGFENNPNSTLQESL